jgi:hypothetical protein
MRSARKRKMGRPRRAEPRLRRLNLSLTDGELESVKRRAEAVGMRPVHFSRALVLADNAKPGVTRPAESNADRLIYSSLTRLGNNLNQLVRHLHATGDPLPPDLEPLLADIRAIIARRYGNDR